MKTMSQDINRLLMEFERSMRSVNREIINPVIPELTVDGLRPVLCLIAHSRARYLKALFELGGHATDARLSDEQIEELARLRREYDELANAAQALETAIQRGYLDIRPTTR